MSRSKKKTPIFGRTLAESEKQDKRKANRVFRKITKRTADAKDAPAPHKREASEVWKFGKDGKYYRRKTTKKDLRK